MAYSKEVVDRFEGVLNSPKQFSVGRFNPNDPDVATGMQGAIITPFYGVFITAVRLAYCVGGIAYDTFFFIPTMASAFHYNFWLKVEGLKQKNNNLN